METEASLTVDNPFLVNGALLSLRSAETQVFGHLPPWRVQRTARDRNLVALGEGGRARGH